MSWKSFVITKISHENQCCEKFVGNQIFVCKSLTYIVIGISDESIELFAL